MKKILIVASVWGFLAKFEAQDVGILQKLGYEVHYASNKYNPVYWFPTDIYKNMGVIFHNIDIYQSPFGIWHNLKAIRQIKNIIQNENISVVHCHTPSGGLVTRLACWRLPVYVIYTAHGFHFYIGAGRLHNLIYYYVEKLLSCITDILITINHEDYEVAKRMCKKNKVYLIPGVGLDREHFHETSLLQRESARAQLGVEHQFFLIGIGELRANKNPEVVIKALAYLKEKRMDIRSIKYGILGAGKQEKKLRKLAEKLDILENIVFFGYQSDVRPYLMAADAIIFPAIREGLGMVALEALSMGVPVLAADNRGSREYMQHEKNGYVCKENTPKTYALCILKMFEEREQWSNNMKRRKEIRKSTEKFDASKTAVIMRGIYENAKD